MSKNHVTHLQYNELGKPRSGILHYVLTIAGKLSVAKPPALLRLVRDGHTFWAKGTTAIEARVLIAGSPPNEYLRTESDGIGGNNLASLPEWKGAA